MKAIFKVDVIIEMKVVDTVEVGRQLLRIRLLSIIATGMTMNEAMMMVLTILHLSRVRLSSMMMDTVEMMVLWMMLLVGRGIKSVCPSLAYTLADQLVGTGC